MKRRQTRTREGQEGNKTNIIGENFQGLHVPPPGHARTAVKRVQAYSTPSAAISNTNSHGQKERKSSQIHQRPRCNRRALRSTTSLGEKESEKEPIRSRSSSLSFLPSHSAILPNQSRKILAQGESRQFRYYRHSKPTQTSKTMPFRRKKTPSEVLNSPTSTIPTGT